MSIEFVNGPYDGQQVMGNEAERFAPFDVGDCLLFPNGHAYAWIGEGEGVTKFKFIRSLSKSERMAMRVCEFRLEEN